MHEFSLSSAERSHDLRLNDHVKPEIFVYLASDDTDSL